MTNAIERRLSALENKAGVGQDEVVVIIRTFVSPGPSGPVSSDPRALISLGQRWRIDREPGEPAESFIRRATETAPRQPGRITRLVEELA